MSIIFFFFASPKSNGNLLLRAQCKSGANKIDRRGWKICIKSAKAKCIHDQNDRWLFSFHNSNVITAEYLVRDGSGRSGHRISAFVRFGKRDHVANRLRAGQQCQITVQADGETAVRWRAELQRLQQVLHLVDVLFQNVVEYVALHGRPVDSYRTAAQFHAVQHEVVVSTDHGQRIFVQQLLLANGRRRKWVVGALKSAVFGDHEQRKLHNPAKLERIRSPIGREPNRDLVASDANCPTDRRRPTSSAPNNEPKRECWPILGPRCRTMVVGLESRRRGKSRKRNSISNNAKPSVAGGDQCRRRRRAANRCPEDRGKRSPENGRPHRQRAPRHRVAVAAASRNDSPACPCRTNASRPHSHYLIWGNGDWGLMANWSGQQWTIRASISAITACSSVNDSSMSIWVNSGWRSDLLPSSL
ncbi:hypothetical protein T02_2613 [Trichinella nativa]|uniref:Uncharacterized protein n=1 Tax=Trichinella nativa TaxID=6335 RepID=A0A0V1L1V4_9BILA|nr:hypothetical protein T02_2613 [Trichinella nativa]